MKIISFIAGLTLIGLISCTSPTDDCIATPDPTCFCIEVYDPVCGCDDVTYSNSCHAECANITTYSQGACL